MYKAQYQIITRIANDILQKQATLKSIKDITSVDLFGPISRFRFV